MEKDVLRKLKREELLEIIVQQKKRIEELEDQINTLEHADDQTLHLSLSDIGTWSKTLRTLADVFECGEKNYSAAPAISGVASETMPADQTAAVRKTVALKLAEDASFIDLDN